MKTKKEHSYYLIKTKNDKYIYCIDDLKNNRYIAKTTEVCFNSQPFVLNNEIKTIQKVKKSSFNQAVNEFHKNYNHKITWYHKQKSYRRGKFFNNIKDWTAYSNYHDNKFFIHDYKYVYYQGRVFLAEYFANGSFGKKVRVNLYNLDIKWVGITDIKNCAEIILDTY